MTVALPRPGHPQLEENVMASSNRAVVFQNVKDMRVESLDFPKL